MSEMTFPPTTLLSGSLSLYFLLVPRPPFCFPLTPHPSPAPQILCAGVCIGIISGCTMMDGTERQDSNRVGLCFSTPSLPAPCPHTSMDAPHWYHMCITAYPHQHVFTTNACLEQMTPFRWKNDYWILTSQSTSPFSPFHTYTHTKTHTQKHTQAFLSFKRFVLTWSPTGKWMPITPLHSVRVQTDQQSNRP